MQNRKNTPLLRGAKGLIYEYTMFLTGELKAFSKAYFGDGNSDNDNCARFVFRFAFEKFLRCTPEDVQKHLDRDIMTRLKLDRILKYLKVPPEIEQTGDYRLLASVIYPERIPVDHQAPVLETYKAVLRGKNNGGLYRFPKKYFDGLSGRERACICFRYMMMHNCSFKSTKEMYSFFATEKGLRLINSNGLKLVLKDVFRSPVLFLHESLPPDMQSDFWYHYYDFQFWYKKMMAASAQQEKEAAGEK